MYILFLSNILRFSMYFTLIHLLLFMDYNKPIKSFSLIPFLNSSIFHIFSRLTLQHLCNETSLYLCQVSFQFCLYRIEIIYLYTFQNWSIFPDVKVLWLALMPKFCRRLIGCSWLLLKNTIFSSDFIPSFER